MPSCALDTSRFHDSFLRGSSSRWHGARREDNCRGKPKLSCHLFPGSLRKQRSLTPYAVSLTNVESQCLFIAEVAYTYSSPLVKLSVLAFYWRIFPTSGMKLGCKIIGAMCIAWCIAVSILDFVQCRPLKAFWYLELRALPTTRCVDTVLHFLANSIANAFIDFLTISLPIYEVCKLYTSTERKFKIAFVFLLGGM